MKKQKGKSDYDYEYDILQFIAPDRDYAISRELDNVVVHFDAKQKVMGIQIFDASKFLRLSKQALRKIPYWQFTVVANNGNIEIKLLLKVEVRNKIVEKNPVIKQKLTEKLPECEILCEG